MYIKKDNKYYNKKTIINNIKFDSKIEALRYVELKFLQNRGKIKDLVLQPKYELIPTFKKTTYIADFSYYDNELGKTIVEDVKGYKTDVYKLKRKMFEYTYPNLTIKEIKAKKWQKNGVIMIKK